MNNFIFCSLTFSAQIADLHVTKILLVTRHQIRAVRNFVDPRY